MRRSRLVGIAGRSPYEIPGRAHAFLIFQAALQHIGHLDAGVLVQRYNRTRGQPKQQRRHAGVRVVVQYLVLDAGKL